MELLQEVSYESNPLLTQIEKEFQHLIDDMNKFYGGMKKRKMNPHSPQAIYNYYYSNRPDKDEVRFTQFNSHLKKIEDLVKEMFHFRSVTIEFQMYSIYGPHTIPRNRTMITVPVYQSDGSSSIAQLRDVGSMAKDGSVRYLVGYPSTIKASKKGILDTSDSIVCDVKLMAYEKLLPKHYVAILLHEIGHNLDVRYINIDVKNDAKMIKVIKTASKDSSIRRLPNTLTVLMKVIKERIKNKREYSDIFGDQVERVGRAVQYGGINKHGEMFADSLPTAFGYGPALVEALHILSNDFKNLIDFKKTRNLFDIYSNYKRALQIASKLTAREKDVHGTNAYRMKVIIKQLEDDLASTRDSAIKRRIKENLEELKQISDDIINEPDRSEELKRMLKAWVDHIEV